MSDFSIDVDLSSALKAMDKVSEAQIAKRARAAMDESLSFLQTEVRNNTPVDTGIGRGSVYTAHQGTVVNLRGRVASPEIYMQVLESGRRAGAPPPPLAPIRRWLERHGMDAGLAFVVARAIGRRGQKPHHMFRNAFEKGRTVVPGIWARHFRL
jgi:hypothetical protein